jgi:hypothetical protein
MGSGATTENVARLAHALADALKNS